MTAEYRVVLSPLTPADKDAFLGLVAASVDLHRPWMSPPGTPETFQAHVRRYAAPDEEALLIRLRDGGALAGFVNINSIIRGRFQSASLSYAAFAPTAGRGYMSDGLALVVRYAFEELRLHRPEAQIQPENRASIRLVERTGFRNEGYSPDLLFIDGAWRGHERWAVTSTMLGIAASPRRRIRRCRNDDQAEGACPPPDHGLGYQVTGSSYTP